MSYVEKNLIDGEKLVFRTGVHWLVLFWPLTVVAVVLGGGIAIFLVGHFVGKIELGTLLVASALVYCLYAVMKRNATEIAVTNRRVIIKTGMVDRRSLEIMLPKVESIGIDEPFWGRLFGYGSVVIHGTGGTPDPFRTIAHPAAFRKCVQEQIDRTGKG
ncbi:MAG TPA: PH domain-containing protein [Candidatus Acidoferrales bacterium]|nr:PH domain-containing protein [Candidatus Acidoferrales bacterium]